MTPNEVIFCKHDEDPSVCPPCRREAGKDKVEAEVPSRAFEARFDSYCSPCNLPIRVSQMIVVIDGRAVHEGCS